MNNENDNIELQIHKEILELSKIEYNNQMNDFDNIEKRSNYIMVLYVAIIPILTAFISLMRSRTLLYLLGLIPLVMILIAGFVLLIIINLSLKVTKIKSKNFLNQKFNDEVDFITRTYKSYMTYIDSNSKRLHVKQTIFNIACWFTVASFVLSILLLIVISLVR